MTSEPAAGYLTVVERLKRVQRLLGVERVYEILAQNGVRSRSVRDLPPRKYPNVIYQCEFTVDNAFAWERIIDKRGNRDARKTRGGVVTLPIFNEAVDAWFHACERELQLTRRELYNDRGEPLR